MKTEAQATAHWPTEVRLRRAEKELVISFDDGASFALPAELLRVESPSAEVQGHGPDQKKTIAGRRHIGIMEVEPVGNYAIRIKFDDMHDTGIFSWNYLHELGSRRDEIWQAYLDRLEAEGKSRDP
jgi:DUF971 family protein